MLNFGTYLLWALAACTFWHGSLAKDLCPNQCNNVVEAQDQGNNRVADNEIKAKLDSLEVKIGEIQAKQEDQQAKLELRLQADHTKVEESLAKLEGILLAIQTRLETVLRQSENQNQLHKNITIPSGFERFGRRHFKIVNEMADWDTAERKCREMGGYLASFQNEHEFNALQAKLLYRDAYWLGINDRDTTGYFVSVASQKLAQFLKWEQTENDRSHEENCVCTIKRKMGTYSCLAHAYYICQADNET